MKRVLLVLTAVTVCALPAAAQTNKAKKKVPPTQQSRGTKQVAGGDGVFGEIYTLKSEFNFSLLSARYTIEPHNDYNGTMATNEEKLVWLTFAIKNSDSGKDHFWGGLDVTLVDENEKNYNAGAGSVRLASQGGKEYSVTLKPGQGVGQQPDKDELSCAIAVPAKAKIKKIILNDGRKTVPSEKVVRYNIAGFPGGSPKNVIAPLPKYAADSSDPTGATLAIPATAEPGNYYPAGYFAIRFDGILLSTVETLDKNKPEDGKQYAILTFTAKNIFSKPISTFELGGQFDTLALRDTDNEKYGSAAESGYALRRAKRDEALNSQEVAVGEEITYRYFFLIPKDAKPASITFGDGKYGHLYKLRL